MEIFFIFIGNLFLEDYENVLELSSFGRTNRILLRVIAEELLKRLG